MSRNYASLRRSSVTPRDPASSTPTDRRPVHGAHLPLSGRHSRVSRDADKVRQRLVLEKLLESTMSDAERTARKLTAARLDELLGKGMKYRLVALNDEFAEFLSTTITMGCLIV